MERRRPGGCRTGIWSPGKIQVNGAAGFPPPGFWNPLPLLSINISSLYKGHEGTLGAMEKLYIKTTVVVTQLSINSFCQKSAKAKPNFIIYKWYFNRAGKKKKKKRNNPRSFSTDYWQGWEGSNLINLIHTQKSSQGYSFLKDATQ